MKTARGALRGWPADRPLWQVGLASAMVAAAASAAIYGVARSIGVPMALTEVFENHYARMPIESMVFASLLDGGVAGTVLATACRRWTTRARTWFVAFASLGLLASFAFPIWSDATTATKIVLSISHLVVAAVIVPALAVALPEAHQTP
jgi:hypothetical protein